MANNNTITAARRPIPRASLTSLGYRAKEVGLAIDISADECEVTIKWPGGDKMADPFTHSHSAHSWLTGYIRGLSQGHANGYLEGMTHGKTTAEESFTSKPHVCLICTGKMYHIHVRRTGGSGSYKGQYDRLDHARNPAFSIGEAVAVAIDVLRTNELVLEVRDADDRL